VALRTLPDKSSLPPAAAHSNAPMTISVTNTIRTPKAWWRARARVRVECNKSAKAAEEALGVCVCMCGMCVCERAGRVDTLVSPVCGGVGATAVWLRHE
jgi:hypothetical protein